MFCLRFVALASFLTVSFACLCPPPFGDDLLPVAFNRASLVVRAKVLRALPIQPCEPPCLGPPIGGSRKWVLKLQRVLKGVAPSPRFLVSSILNARQCGSKLEVGTSYLLPLSPPFSFVISVSQCMGIRPWNSLGKRNKKVLRFCVREGACKEESA